MWNGIVGKRSFRREDCKPEFDRLCTIGNEDGNYDICLRRYGEINAKC